MDKSVLVSMGAVFSHDDTRFIVPVVFGIALYHRETPEDDTQATYVHKGLASDADIRDALAWLSGGPCPSLIQIHQQRENITVREGEG